MSEAKHLTQQFQPVFDEQSKILILGTFPSVKSRENQFYYGHPQNRFWKVMASLLNEPVPVTIDEKKQILLKHQIALWDVIESCEIVGSSDSSIKNVVPANLSVILDVCNIQNIYANGKTADKLYHKHLKTKTERDIICLPSTSPANAAFSLERLITEWSIILVK